ncbi:MAG: HNH endonuclease signature motif containing protein [Elusimicrobiota bacterium]
MEKQNTSRYRFMRLTKIARRDGCEVIRGVIYARCYICHKKDKLERFTIDHAIAKCNGGTNKLSNLRICCKSCNRYKAELEMPKPIPIPFYRRLYRMIRKFIRRKIWILKNIKLMKGKYVYD